MPGGGCGRGASSSGFTLAGTDGIGRNANRYAVAYTIWNNDLVYIDNRCSPPKGCYRNRSQQRFCSVPDDTTETRTETIHPTPPSRPS